MVFDLTEIPARSVYKLLLGVVVPRPIALVTTVDDGGRVNCAPFSFFNLVSSDPPIVALGIGPGEGDANALKDTWRNLDPAGDFVCNLVDEPMAEKMNVCAFPFPAGTSELERSGLTPRSGVKTRAPVVAESPASLECEVTTTIRLGRASKLVLGRVTHLHVRDDLVEPTRHHIHGEKLRLIARMHGSGWYARTSDLFQMARLR